MGRRKGATRARAREDADAGVRRCVELMTSGAWVRGVTHRDVAKKFGVAESTAKDWATNASRIVRYAVEGDIEETRARMLATLDSIIAKAMRVDLKAAVSAIAEQAKLQGIGSTKFDVTHHGAIASMTPEQHRAELAKLQAEIGAELERIGKGETP